MDNHIQVHLCVLQHSSLHLLKDSFSTPRILFSSLSCPLIFFPASSYAHFLLSSLYSMVIFSLPFPSHLFSSSPCLFTQLRGVVWIFATTGYLDNFQSPYFELRIFTFCYSGSHLIKEVRSQINSCDKY